MSLFPYNLEDLFVGRVRILRASPDDVAIFGSIDDVIDMETPYDPPDDVVDFGATKESASYQKGFTEQSIAIQQVDAAVMTDVTETNRSMQLSVAELSPENLQVIENSPAIDTIPAGPGRSEQKAVPFGAITDLKLYRIAFIGIRKGLQGIVTESGGKTRGRLAALVSHRCSLSADNSQIEFAKGGLAAAPITFTAFPDPDGDEGEEYGTWLFEEPGEIASS